MINFFKEIWLRVKADTPIFWQEIRSLAICILGISTALWAANSQLNLELAVGIITVLKYTIAVCTVIASMATLTKTDSNDTKQVT